MSQDVRNRSQFGRRERPRFINSALQRSRGRLEQKRAQPVVEVDPSLPNRAGPVPPVPKPELKGFWGNKDRKPLSMTPQGKAKLQKPQQQKTHQIDETPEEELKPLHNERVTNVMVEGQVILQIMKHARSNEAKRHTGVLQGLKKPESNTLEVTYAISVPDDAKSKAEDQQFARKMLECLESINIDRMEVGWYRTCVNSNIYDEDTIIRCAQWREGFQDSIMLVYDSRTTQHGRLSLRAYQLTKEFYDLFITRSVGHTAFADAELGYEDILHEIPIQIHNSYIVHAFLYDLQNIPEMCSDYARLTHWRNSQLSHNLTAMEHSIEDYYNLQNDYRKWQQNVNKVRKERDRQRSKCQNAAQIEMLERNLPLPDEPSRVRSILSCAQLNEFANAMYRSIVQMHAKTLMQRAIVSDS